VIRVNESSQRACYEKHDGNFCFIYQVAMMGFLSAAFRGGFTMEKL
jgi:hypothetical protein